MWALLRIHARHCRRVSCAVPRCAALKEYLRPEEPPLRRLAAAAADPEFRVPPAAFDDPLEMRAAPAAAPAAAAAPAV